MGATRVGVPATARRPSGTGADGPLVVGFGGTRRQGSSSERLLRAVLDDVERRGARTELLCADEIDLPMYEHGVEGGASAERFVDAVRRADALVIASPGYHGSISGLVKNAIDWIEELRGDPRPYLDTRPVGLIACAHGWQATVTTLATLRTVVHALRGWPTPLGLAVNSAANVFDDDGRLIHETVITQVQLMSHQVHDGARAAARAARVQARG